MPKLYSFISQIYQGKLHSTLKKEIPEESFAPCSTCPVSCQTREELNQPDAKPFWIGTKCCTYHPLLPNYLVGAILADPSLEKGHQRIREKIQQQHGVYPQGIYPPKKYDLLYERGQVHGFGRSKALLCPYYDEGNCTIWQYRDAVCSTYYCKYLAGEQGRTLWTKLLNYLAYIQKCLAMHGTFALGLSYFEPYTNNNQLSLEELDEESIDSTFYQSIWQQWVGKEEEYFIQCYEVVKKLTRKEFEQLFGIQELVLVKELATALDNVLDVPHTLQLNLNGPIKQFSDTIYQVVIETSINNLERKMTHTFQLSKQILDLFDGKNATKEIQTYLDDNHNILLSDELILTLFHHKVLVNATA